MKKQKGRLGQEEERGTVLGWRECVSSRGEENARKMSTGGLRTDEDQPCELPRPTDEPAGSTLHVCLCRSL